jgi:hypothetical protein
MVIDDPQADPDVGLNETSPSAGWRSVVISVVAIVAWIQVKPSVLHWLGYKPGPPSPVSDIIVLPVAAVIAAGMLLYSFTNKPAVSRSILRGGAVALVISVALVVINKFAFPGA